MRILILLLLALAARAEPAPALLQDRAVISLGVAQDAVWAETETGFFVIRKYGVARGSPNDAPIARERVVEHAGFRWRATTSGIVRTRLAPLFTRYELPNSDRVHALAAGPDGSIWCGTQRGVARYRDGRFTAHLEDRGLITTVAVDRAGRIWVGSGSAFTSAYRYDGNRWERVEGIDAFVHKIAMDEAGTLWFAALNAPGGDPNVGQGAWYWTDDGFREAAWLTGKRVYDVAARDPSGVLWFATLRGLVAYRGNGRVTHYTPQSGELAAEKVWCLSAASDGSLWVGYQSDGAGVSRLASGHVTHFTVRDGLSSDQVWAIAEGRRGVHWIATDAGLSRYDGRRWSRLRFTEKPLWPLLPRPDGSLWIGSIRDGLWHYRPHDREAPKSELRANDNRVAWSATDAWLNTPAKTIWTRYRVDGGAWSRATAGASGDIAVPPGRHTVEVQAIDRFGNAESPPASLTVDGKDLARGWVRWLWIGLLWTVGCLAAIGFLVRKRGS